MRFKLMDELSNVAYLSYHGNGDWYVISKDLQLLDIKTVAVDVDSLTTAFARAQTPSEVLSAVRSHIDPKWTVLILDATWTSGSYNP